MVGKRLHSVSPSTSKRSPVLNVEPALANRPKRNISPKNLDLNAGLSWREERELKKALYASLQEVKRPYLKSEEETTSNSEACSSSGIANQSPVNESDDAVSSRTRRQSSRQSRPSGHSSSTEVTPVKLTVRSTSLDESSQDSLRSSLSNSTQDSLKKDDEKKKYRAQRKFAQMQGYSPSSTPNHTPVKLISKTVSPMKLFPKRAKTEDFLTFLCLRGTNALPPHLDFFNYSRDDGDSSYPATPSNGRPGSAMRDSSPSSSSTGCSNIQEEGFDPPVLPVVPKLMTPNRKAARACAGTPEIARGFASVSPRKNTSAKASPLSGRKHRGKSSLDITPSKQTAKRSITSPRKLSPLRKSSIRSLSKTKTSDRITMKRRAVATLTSVARISPKKALRKKASIFNEDSEASSSLLPDTDKKIVKRKYERRVDSKKRQNIKHMRRKKKEDKNKESFIATRLPKRNASKRAFKLYMELDDIDDSLDRQRKVRRSRFVRTRNFNRREIYTDEVGIVGSTDESMDELEKWNDERTVRLKRKSVDSLTFDSEDSEISFPLKDKRKKGENKTEKKRTLKTDLFNKDSKVDKYNKPVSSVSDTSPRMNTRSSSTLNSQNLLQISPKKISSAKICANKKLIRIKSLKKQLKHTKKEKIDLLLKKKKGKLDKREKNSSKKAGLWLSKRQNKITDKDRVRLKNLKIEPFPSPGDPAQLVEIPAFYPSEEEFRDPIKYIQSIHDKAEPFGMCKIVPPLSWKPDSKVNEEMRFTTQKQYIHKMYHRYGPNVQQFESIKKHLESHGVSEPMPVIGGAEIDLCKLSATIHEFGGMQNVMEKKKWLKVADAMKIPKSAQDRGTKLYDAYCKFLLSYDTMSLEEKSNVEEQVKVERDKIKLEGKEDDCIVKGKNMTLLSFNRTARNALSVWFKDDPPIAEQVEAEFWKIVKNRSDHVVVHGGHVDLHTHQCSLFPSKRDNHYSRHQWNLNNLPYNYSSILKYLGPVPGISVPTLHIGMLYTASCWSTDIHYLPYVQYLHTESDIIWYSVPKQEESKFKDAMKELVPTLMKKEERWLKEDTVIVPPEDLIKKGVSIGRCVQSPRQFVVVFPKCYTSTVSCGYTLAESVHYTKSDWIPQGVMAAKELHRCKEQELFSMDELLCNMVQDTNLCISDLELAFPAFQHMIEEELHLRKQLQEAGLKTSKKMCTPELPSRCSPSHSSRKSSSDVEEIVTVCDISKQICYLSLVLNEADDLAFSLEEGLSHIHKKRNIKSCKLMYRHTEEELKKMLDDVKERLNTGHGGSDKTGRRNTKIKAEDYSKS